MDPYEELSGEEKVRLAIDFVARHAPIPDSLQDFLRGEGLLEAITAPGDQK